MVSPAAETRARRLLELMSSLTAEDWDRVRLGAPNARAAFGECPTDQIELLAFKEGRHTELETWVSRAVATIPPLGGEAHFRCFSAAVTGMSAVFCADLLWDELIRSAYAPLAVAIPIDACAPDLNVRIPAPASPPDCRRRE